MKAYLISHTHWDREWYQTFQDYRARLVNLLDELIGSMEKTPAFKYYHLDGQTIVLEDYLEVRPENRKRLQRLIQQGRLIPGPWYVMPDEFLISGEALIRNLQIGAAISRAWGVEPMKVGYIVDIFGHNTQMPQLCQGFGMESVVAFRGVSGMESSAEFIWEGADGSSVFFYRLPDETAYSNFFYKVRKPQLTGAPFDLDRGCADLKALIESEQARSTTGVLLLMDGVDHVEITPELPALLERMREVMPQAQIVHGRLEDFHRDSAKHKDQLPRHSGELRTPRMTPCIWPDSPCLNDLLANVLSSRIHLKQRNVAIQELLERQAEPWAVCAETASHREIGQYFDLAWRHLIQNHPHDSICGCSIDQVHQEMLYRFDQSEQIGRRIAAESVAAIHAAVQPPAEGEYLVSVFNPSPFPRQGVTLELVFPDPCPDAFSLTQRDGTPVPFQRLAAQEAMRIVRPYRDVPSGSSRTVQTVFADVTVPALGYTTLVYKPVADGCPTVDAAPAAAGSPDSPNVLENGLVRLAFDPDGTATLTDLATGEVYPGLNAFEDGGDTGDGWKYIPPANDRIVTGLSDVSVAVTTTGPFVASAVVRGTLIVPAGLTDDKKERHSETACLRVSSTFTLRRGSRRVDVRTEIDNTARDHVIKTLFPARAESCESFADSMFDVVRRDIRKPAGVVFHEPWQENRPLESFVGIGDARRGLAVFAKGLHEGGVRDDATRTVFLTVLRCFGHTVMTLGEEGGQMLGRHVVEYAFMPTRDGELPAVLAEREQFLHPVRCSHSLDILLNRRPFTGTREDSRSFLSISDPRVVLSALRRNPRGDLILRVFNPTPDPVKGTVTFGFPVTHAVETNLLEEPEGRERRPVKDRLTLQLKPKRILTLLLRPAIMLAVGAILVGGTPGCRAANPNKTYQDSSMDATKKVTDKDKEEKPGDANTEDRNKLMRTKIVCLGDSITGQPNLASYMKWSFILEAMCDAARGPGVVQVVNRGVGGDTSEGALRRLQGDVLDERPDIVVILLGGNDAGQKRPSTAVKADLEAIVRKTKAAGAKVLLLQYAVLPNLDHPETAWVHLDENNALIAEIADAEQVPLLNMATVMEDALKNQQVTELKGRDQDGVATWETRPLAQNHLVSATDGVHLSPGGELVFARAIFDKLSRLEWL